MATLILVRHGLSTANSQGILAGRMPGVELDARGVEQVHQVGQRLRAVPLTSIITSPSQRCRQTAEAIRGARDDATPLVVEDGLDECDYGDWQGGAIKELIKDPLWEVVQERPSTVTFPQGEAMAQMQRRAVAAVRDHDASIAASRGDRAVWVAVSHGDVIKSVLAAALDLDLDRFQRLHVDPASVSIVHYGPRRAVVLAVNTSGGDLSWLAAPPASDEVVPGGGAGPQSPDSKGLG